jgi:hypothetical protein
MIKIKNLTIKVDESEATDDQKSKSSPGKSMSNNKSSISPAARS